MQRNLCDSVTRETNRPILALWRRIIFYLIPHEDSSPSLVFREIFLICYLVAHPKSSAHRSPTWLASSSKNLSLLSRRTCDIFVPPLAAHGTRTLCLTFSLQHQSRRVSNEPRAASRSFPRSIRSDPACRSWLVFIHDISFAIERKTHLSHACQRPSRIVEYRLGKNAC